MYFGPQLGGTELKYDYCPFQEVFTYKDGRGTYCNDAKNTPKGTNFLGEFYGPGSSCLYEGIKGWSVTTVPTEKLIERIPNNSGAGCYQVSTTRGITTVTVLNKTYQCSRSGQQALFFALKFGISGKVSSSSSKYSRTISKFKDL
ncbi:hypothetical protein EMCRGX_G033428 [Ephydatia muelleri]